MMLKILSAIGAVFLLALAWGVSYVFFPQIRVTLYNVFTPGHVVQTLECGDIKVEKINDPTRYIDNSGGDFYSVVEYPPDSKIRITNTTGKSVSMVLNVPPEIVGDGVTFSEGWGEVPLPFNKVFSAYEISHSISMNKLVDFSDLARPGINDGTASETWHTFRTGSGAAFIGFKSSFLTEQQFQSLQTCAGFKELVDSTLPEGNVAKDIFFYLQSPSTTATSTQSPTTTPATAPVTSTPKALPTPTAPKAPVQADSLMRVEVPDKVESGRIFQIIAYPSPAITKRFYEEKGSIAKPLIGYWLVPVSDPSNTEVTTYPVNSWGEEITKVTGPVVSNVLLDSVGFTAHIPIPAGTYRLRVEVTSPKTITESYTADYATIATGESNIFELK